MNGNKFSATGKLLSILENNTEATGKLKSKIDLLEREFHALREKLIEHDTRGEAGQNEIRKELDEFSDILKELKVELKVIVNNSSIEKLSDALDATDQFYAPQVQEVITQMDIIVKWIEVQEKVSAATVTAKWKFWTVIVAAFLTQIGIIVGIFYK